MSDRQARPALSAEQQAAIDDRERDLFLAAGAGTGKTTVLVERFCEAVCAEAGEDADVGVENVLAFTFTDRAAGELTRRIRAELARRSGDEPEPGRARHLRTLARDAESAWISTIHSFCRRVLAAHPLAVGLDPEFRVLDESEAARVGAEAFEAAFRRYGEREGDDRFELPAAFRLPTLRTIVRSAHDELRARGCEPPTLPAMPPSDVGSAVRDLRDAARGALAVVDGLGASRPVERCREQIVAALTGTEGKTPTEAEVVDWRPSSSARALEAVEVTRYREACQTLERRLVEVEFAHHWEYLRELLGLYAEEYGARKVARSALDYEDLQLRARRLLRDRPDLRERYRRRFRHLMVDELQDTNALQLEIVGLLHEDECGEPQNRLFTVGDELQSIYGFRHADVEVFRSTRRAAEAADPGLAAVRRLSGNFRSQPGVLALVNHLGRELCSGDYDELAVGAVQSAEPPAEREAPAAEVLVTEREGWDDPSAAGTVSADERAQAWRVVEARFLAARLAELHRRGVPRGEMVVLLRSFSYVEAYEDALEQAGLAPQVIGGRGYWSKQQVADVRNLLACVANPLDDKALFGALASPACGVESDTLWLLSRAAGGGRVWPVVRWLYGPAPAGPAHKGAGEEPRAGEDAAARDAWRERVDDVARHVPTEDADAVRGFVDALLRVREESARLSLAALIDRTIGAFGYDLALLMRRRGRRRMANVRKLMRLAREFEEDDGRDLRGFLDFVDVEVETAGREAEAAVEAEGHDGVRLMTVHAAKGLEFPTVAVADLGRGLSAGVPPALRLDPAPGADGGQPGRAGLRLARLGRSSTPIFDFKVLEAEAVDRERQEEKRILHVAMTRAEQRLILSGACALEKLGDERKDTDPLIVTVLRALGWQGQDSVALEPPPGVSGAADSRPVEVPVRVRRPGDVPADPPAPEAAGATEDAVSHDGAAVADLERPLPDPELRPLPSPPAMPLRHVSYSALALYERCGYRFYAERVLGLRPRRPGGAPPAASLDEHDAAGGLDADEWHPAVEAPPNPYARGRVIHELLERSARGGFAAPDRRHAAALLRREGVAADRVAVNEAVASVEGFLSSPLRRELAAAARLLPEVPFAFRMGGLVVRGEIDLLAELRDEVLVLDYKSDALRDQAPADHMDRYRVQRDIYALAALRRYGRPVRVAYVFLERPAEPVAQRFEAADVDALALRLGELTGEIAAGRFEVTDAPERDLCLDCPARERLCVHGPELTLRETAAAAA